MEPPAPHAQHAPPDGKQPAWAERRSRKNATGYRGVSEKPDGKFQAKFTSGKQRSIGLFDKAEAAALEVEEAELSGLRMSTKKRAPRGTVCSPRTLPYCVRYQLDSSVRVIGQAERRCKGSRDCADRERKECTQRAGGPDSVRRPSPFASAYTAAQISQHNAGACSLLEGSD